MSRKNVTKRFVESEEYGGGKRTFVNYEIDPDDTFNGYIFDFSQLTEMVDFMESEYEAIADLENIVYHFESQPDARGELNYVSVEVEIFDGKDLSKYISTLESNFKWLLNVYRLEERDVVIKTFDRGR